MTVPPRLRAVPPSPSPGSYAIELAARLIVLQILTDALAALEASP